MQASGEVEIEQVYLRETGRLYELCWHITRNKQDAEDALQHVFVQAVRAKKILETHPEVVAWLTKVAKNACIDIIRRRRGDQIVDLDRSEPGEQESRSGWDRLADRTMDAEHRLEWTELLRVAWSGLTPLERRAIELVHAEGFTRRQAGLLVGVADPYPMIKAAERKVKRTIEALAARGEPNAQSLLQMLAEDDEGDHEEVPEQERKAV